MSSHLPPRLHGHGRARASRRTGACFRASLLLASCAAAALALSPAIAVAAPGQAAEDKVRADARALADQGFALYDQGRYQEAVEAFLAAERKFHAPTVVLYRARAYGKLGWLLQARNSYEEIIHERLDPSAPPPYIEAQEQARKELAALQPRIPGLLIVVRGAPPEQVQVSVGRYPVPPTGRERLLPQNPGEHTITVSAQGHATQSRTVMLREGTVEPVMFNLGPGAPEARPSPTPTRDPQSAPEVHGGATPPGDAGEDREAAQGGSLVPAAIALTAGVVGLGLGAAAGLMALDRRSDLDAICPERRCALGSAEDFRRATAAHAQAEALGTLSTWSLVAGGAATALGVTLVLIRPSGDREPGAEIGVGPASIRVRGRF